MQNCTDLTPNDNFERAHARLNYQIALRNYQVDINNKYYASLFEKAEMLISVEKEWNKYKRKK